MAKNYLKRFMEWVIGSRNNLFLWARLKLTFLYIAFIAFILTMFSLGLYVSIDKNVRDNINDKIKSHAAQAKAIAQTDKQLMGEFGIGDVILLFISGGLAFFLAGKNLRPIQDALEKQKRFAADASHDLRTPLAIMKTDCEVSLRKKEISKEELRELLTSNLEEINRMSAMAEQLLFLSRNNKTLNQQTEIISLGEVAKKMVKSFKSLATNKGITLDVHLLENGNIKGNRVNLEKLFLNIIKNALEYTPVGGKIEVFVGKNKKHMELSVKDNGVGIGPDDLPHVLEAFYKVDKVRGQENVGSGLGLSIVDEIVKNHGATILIESEINQGTNVKIKFPLFG